MSGVREQLLNLGWSQGSIIEAGDVENEILSAQGADAFLVINQTCDLVNPSWDKEPAVELLPLARIRKSNSAFLNGRNPRQIHFQVAVGRSACFMEAFAPRTITLPRQLLLQTKPSESWLIGELALKSLLAWRAARYLRTAFPDAFENRLKPIFDRFKKLVESIHEHIKSLHIGLNTFERLPEDEPYEMDLLLVIRRSSRDDAETYAFLDAKAKELKTLINSASNLVCTSCKIRAPHEVTLEEIDGYLRWERHDYLSFGEHD